METSFKLLSETDYHNLNVKLDRILAVIEDKEVKPQQSLGKWMTEKEVQELTGKKATTLWKMRNKGLLEFTKINNKVFYNRESIIGLMEQNKRTPFRKPPPPPLPNWEGSRDKHHRVRRRVLYVSPPSWGGAGVGLNWTECKSNHFNS